ncbi:MAG: hypothetical protein E7199_04595 [Schwartzia succinivorans]|nr:hypothetical protein [Schwartzia succinivorans]
MERDRTMTGQQLKNAILALAVQGKLVPQNSKDEPAAALLERVKAEKARLVKAGKIKKKKPLPPITDEEKPFSIPKTWEWVRLGECSTYGQVKLKATDKDKKSKIWSLDLEEIEKDTGHVLIKRQAIDKPIRGEKIKFGKGDILYSKLRPYLKKIVVAAEDGICTTEIVPFKVFCEIDADYIAYVLRSPHIDYEINAASYGAKMPRVGTDTMLHLLIPIPPLAEQKRIVEKIEELLPRVSAYDEAEQKLSRLDAEFPDKLKKSILQQAVQGKLAKQDKNDEPTSELLKRIKAEKERLIAEGRIKKEKPLPPIAEEEKPFEIPAGWEWVRFANLMEFLSTGPFGSVLHKNEYVHNGIPIVNPACIQHGKIIPVERMSVAASTKERLKMYVLHAGNIVIGRRGELGRCAIVSDMEAGWLCGTGCFFMNPFVELNRRFIQMVLASDYAKNYFMKSSVGTTMNNLNHQILKMFLFPLPPLEEQKRIVVCVDEFSMLCNEITSE